MSTEPKVWKAFQTGKASGEMTWNCCWHCSFKVSLFIVCKAVATDNYSCVVIGWYSAEDSYWIVAFHVKLENPRKLSFQTWSFGAPVAGIFLRLILKPKENCVTGPDFSSDTWNQFWGMLKGFWVLQKILIVFLTQVPYIVKPASLTTIEWFSAMQQYHKKKKKKEWEKQKRYKPTKKTTYRATSLDLFYQGTKYCVLMSKSSEI